MMYRLISMTIVKADCARACRLPGLDPKPGRSLESGPMGCAASEARASAA